MESRWRAQAERSSSLRCSLPAVLAEKWNEAARLQQDRTKGIMAPLDQPQILILYIPDRHNHSSAFGELRKKRCGHGGCSRCHENGVVRSKLRQTKRSVAAVHVSIVIAEARETLGSFRSQPGAELHGEDVARQASQHGGLIAKSRSDF